MNKSSERTKSRILAAAAEVFSEKGFRGATVRDISRAARVNLAAIHYHFTSKDLLYRETCRTIARGFRDLMKQFDWPEVSDEAQWRQALIRYAAVMLDFVTSESAKERQERRVFDWERLQPTPGVMRLLSEEFFQPVTDRLRALIRLALPPDTPPHEENLWVMGMIGQCAFYDRARGELRPQLIPEALSRDAWLAQTAQHIAASVYDRLSFRGASKRPKTGGGR